MPILLDQTNQIRSQRLLIWHAKESLLELQKIAELTDQEQHHLHGIKFDKRKQEWLITNLLFKKYTIENQLRFHSNGKPFLSNKGHVSISHSGNLGGIILSKRPVGMDVQEIDLKIERIQHKFTNAFEQSFLPSDVSRIAYLTIIWSIKESIFKYFGELVDFSDDIQVLPFHPNDALIFADYQGIHGEMKFELFHKIVHPTYHLVHTLN